MPAKPQQGVPIGMADYWAIVQRRFWWILLPLFFCWFGVWAVGWFLPPTYESEALILVEHQKVPRIMSHRTFPLISRTACRA